MPFHADFDPVFEAVQQAASSANSDFELNCYWLKDVAAAGRITDDIVDGLTKSALCIADLSENNPNVMWEAGYAMALGKPTVLIGQDVARLPFDLRVHRVLPYDRQDLRRLTDGLRDALEQTIARYEIRATAPRKEFAAPAAPVIAVTGSMSGNAARLARRMDQLLPPYLGQGALWYCGSYGLVDDTVVPYLLSRRERVVVVGTTAMDLSPDIRSLVEAASVPFLDASVESVPLVLPELSPRVVIFLSKADLVVAFWNGESRGTQAVIRHCQDVRRNLLLGYI
jgi:hypothetical protein